MDNFARAIHQKFVRGSINGAVFDYMSKLAMDNYGRDGSLFDAHMDNLAGLDIKTADECRQYFSIYVGLSNCTPQVIKEGELANDLYKYAFSNRGRYDLTKKHMYHKMILDFVNDHTNLVKSAHPNNTGVEDMEIQPPYDLDKWIETMRYIYDVAAANNLPLDDVQNSVVANWPDDREKMNFKRWMRYYQEGNYGKYNVKTAQFYTQPKPEAKVPDVKDMFQPPLPKVDPNAEKKQRLQDARKKLRGRLKSVEELLEVYRDVLPQDTSSIMRKDIFDLKEKILGLELKASLVDSIIRTSNQFNKHGFIEGATELRKIAQEVADDKLPEVKQEVIPAPVQKAVEPEPPVEKPVEKEISAPMIDVDSESIEMPDFNSATHREALQKLEEINKVISERNVVRALAAVDIILGQMGIASYFPQLSEAQQKLMDAFAYASPRIAETIGQMRGGSDKAKTDEGKKPQQEAIEVEEDLAKPVGEVSNTPPVQPAKVK